MSKRSNRINDNMTDAREDLYTPDEATTEATTEPSQSATTTSAHVVQNKGKRLDPDGAQHNNRDGFTSTRYPGKVKVDTERPDIYTPDDDDDDDDDERTGDDVEAAVVPEATPVFVSAYYAAAAPPEYPPPPPHQFPHPPPPHLYNPNQPYHPRYNPYQNPQQYYPPPSGPNDPAAYYNSYPPPGRPPDEFSPPTSGNEPAINASTADMPLPTNDVHKQNQQTSGTTIVAMLLTLAVMVAIVFNVIYHFQNYDISLKMIATYWMLRLAVLMLTALLALRAGSATRPLTAPLVFAAQAQETRGAWLRLVLMLGQTGYAFACVFYLLVDGYWWVDVKSPILSGIALVIVLFATFVTAQSARFGVLGIAQVYVGVMFATAQLLTDAAVASADAIAHAIARGYGDGSFSTINKAIIVMQVFLLVYELVRQALGGYITYFDNVAYIRANDVTALRKVRELFAHVNWSERHCQKVVFYTAPYSSTSSVASHINQLVDELSTGRVVQGSNWLTVAGFGNNDGRQAQQLLGDLLFMPTIDAGLFGRSGSSSDNFVYTIKGHRFVANKDGTNIRATDEMPRTRLEVPWMLH